MNDLVHVKKSSIHGRGLFARKDIPADALLGALEGVPTESDGAYVIWAVDATGSSGLRMANVLRFVNHAKEPNGCFCEMELWTLRPIKAGEEITHDYELSGER